MRRTFVVIALLTAVFAAVAVWPQGFGLAGRYGPAQVVAMRGLAVAGGLLIVGALFVSALRWRRARPYLLTVAAVLAVATMFSAAVMVGRGLGSGADDSTSGDVRVLAFNTLHDGVAAPDLAELVQRHDADVVVLPETSRTTAENVAELAGGGFQVIHHQIDSVTSATALLVAEDLGVYGRPDPNPTGALASFTAWPQTPGSPPITAVHAYPPSRDAMDGWRDDTAWAVDRCSGVEGAIVAGDFNATLDHPSMRDLGPCVDAAAVRDAAAVGTWPAGWPRWAGTPIDHILVDSRTWHVESFKVLDALGGSDHRPVLAVLRRS